VHGAGRNLDMGERRRALTAEASSPSPTGSPTRVNPCPSPSSPRTT